MAATFLSGLDPVLVDKIRAAGARRTYPPRSYLYYEGDPSTGVFVVESGLLRIDRTTHSGRIVLLDLAMKGSLNGEIGVIEDAPRSATFSTLTECRVRFVPAKVFREMLRDDADVNAAVMTRLARRLRALSTQFVETSTFDAASRVAACLVRLVEIDATITGQPAPDRGVIDLKLPINQEELGQWAGLAREGAVKGLGTLRSIGLIETGRMQVRILDLEALRSRADGG